MNIFFDTEFTGLHKDTTLISLGMISENGKTFYAEFTDYNKDQCNDWIKENVLSNLAHNNQNLKADLMVCGTKQAIAEELRKWLKQFDSVQLISDVCHYDMVLFIDIFGGSAFDIPSNVNASCHDINQDIARFVECSEDLAFDMSREELSKEFGYDNEELELKHNSLYDAIIIKQIYDGIKKDILEYE